MSGVSTLRVLIHAMPWRGVPSGVSRAGRVCGPYVARGGVTEAGARVEVSEGPVDGVVGCTRVLAGMISLVMGMLLVGM